MRVQTFDTVPTDAQLLAGIARHDEASLAALYDRYHRLAFSLALRVVNDRGRAEDVVQDAFLSVWRKAGTFAEGRGARRRGSPASCATAPSTSSAAGASPTRTTRPSC